MLLVPILLLALDLNSIKAEPDLEKRSKLALELADQAVDAARKAYKTNEIEKVHADLDEVVDSVELAHESLEETGKRPRKSKAYKHAEQQTAKLLRRLDGLKESFGYEDQTAVEKTETRVGEIHDKLLQEIMSKRK